MKSLAIINDRIQESLPVESTGTANISGTNITCGIVDVPRPHFDAKQEYTPKLLEMIHQLVDRLNKINDGSFEIEDMITKHLESLI